MSDNAPAFRPRTSPVRRVFAARPDADAPPRRRRFSFGTFASLRHRDYRLLWIGILFTSGGLWMEMVALNWLVYDLTNSAVDLGILNGMRALPALIIGPFGGVAADRYDRKRLLLWTQAILLVLYAALGGIILLDLIEVWHLMVFALVTGLVWTFNQPVRQAVLPSLVPKEDMANAAALQSTAFNATRVLGPAVGGVLMGWVGAGGAMLAVAGTWVAVQVATALLRVPPTPPRTSQASGVWQDLLEGFRYIARTPDVRGLILIALVPFILIMPYMTLLTIFVKDIFHMDATGLGVLMSVSGVGALAATLGVASLGNYRGKGKLLIGSGFMMAVTLMGFAFAPWLPLSYLMLVLVTGASMAYLALTNTLLFLIVPNEFRGRVMSVYMLDRGLMPLGSLLAGGLAALWSAPVALGLMGAVGLAFTAAVAILFPSVRRLE
ncbi:MAG: MFS transporter [Chloroflexi bacterium]|nr:MFS transporter [Chloroflexota bacterium]